ncbi:MAG: hypothetical protein OET90_07250 [Desulfuromonadales bacterium]|nr:hypothetical protein [Desulfuromonadales bacterium]
MGCCSNNGGNTGPFAEGRELVEFVYHAHGGALRDQAIQGGGLSTSCQGCGAEFILATFVGQCQACGGVHAVSPPRSDSVENIQFAGKGYTLPKPLN